MPGYRKIPNWGRTCGKNSLSLDTATAIYHRQLVASIRFNFMGIGRELSTIRNVQPSRDTGYNKIIFEFLVRSKVYLTQWCFRLVSSSYIALLKFLEPHIN
uniref:Uncharacterized protein n=1 Tax=Parascaris univalens TaxID=6257 RepID=A0A915AV63_PARUN